MQTIWRNKPSKKLAGLVARSRSRNSMRTSDLEIAPPKSHSCVKSFLRFLCLLLLFVVGVSAQNGSNYIIQNPGSNPYTADIAQLESDSVQAFLAAHNLPSTDAALLYKYGRRDLRDELRAWIFGSLQSIISTPASSRTTHQQNLYNWLEVLVYRNEVAQYKAAIAEYSKFVSSPCTYTLDPTISQAYNLSYNPSQFCYLFGQYFLQEPTPAESYFLTVGMENSYDADLTADPNAPSILVETASLNEANVGYAVIPGAATGAVSGALYATATIAPFAFRAFNLGTSFIPAADAADIGLASAGTAVGVFGIVVTAAAIAVQAGMEVQQTDQIQAGLSSMQSYYNSLVQNCNSIDLNTFLTDSTGVGTYKLLTAFLATTLPDVPSTTPLPTRTEGVDPIWGVDYPNAPTSDSMLYTDWHGRNWSVTLWGNYVLQTLQPCPTNIAAAKCYDPGRADSFGVTLQAITPAGLCNGMPCGSDDIEASRIGTNWLIANPQASSGATLCPVGTSGLSPGGTSASACSASVSDRLYLFSLPGYIYATVQTWSVLTPPVFATNGLATFVDGKQQSIVLSAQESNPSYAGQDILYRLIGSMPPQFAVSTNSSGLTLTYDGQPSANLPGTYNFTASATVGYGGTGGAPYVNGTTPLSVTVKPGDSIQVRSNTLTAHVGDTVNFQITAPGAANPNIQLVGVNLPPGLSFTQHGQIAMIAGTASASGSSSGTIETNYGASTPLTVDITFRKSPAFTSPSTWTFTDNVESRFQVLLSPLSQPGPLPDIFVSSMPFPEGFVSSVSTLANAVRPLANASWLQVQTSNGKALLSGTPPTGTGPLVIYLASVLPNSLPAFQTLTINPSDQPAVTGPDLIVAPTPVPVTNNTSVTVVTLPITNINLNTLTILSSTGTILNGSQVSLTMTPGFAGLVPVTTYYTAAGTYCPIPSSTTMSRRRSYFRNASFTTADSLVSAAQTPASNAGTGSNLIPFHTFNVEIDQPPSIKSAVTTYFLEGISNTFFITTGGFPEATPVPTSTSSAKAMRITLSGTLPTGVTFTDLSPGGSPTGTGVLSGTPTQTGSFPLTFTANNGVGNPATQHFTLVVNKAGDVNGDGVVNCTDIAIVKAAFGSYQGQATYDPRADVNHDFKINILDLSFVASRLQVGTRCQ